MKNKNYFNLEIILLFRLNKYSFFRSLTLTMSSIMSQAVQHIINANAPMVFNYAYSRPEVRRTVYPTGIEGNLVHTLDAETGKFKKFKLDGISFPQPDVGTLISYAMDQGLTVSFNYNYSNSFLTRVGVPVKFSKNGNSVLLKLEVYLPCRRWANQDPNYVEHKYFNISGIENLKLENSFESLPQRPEWMVDNREWFQENQDVPDTYNRQFPEWTHTIDVTIPVPLEEVPTSEANTQFPEWIMNTDWSHGLDDEEPFNVEDLDEEEPLEVELIDLSPYLRGDGSLEVSEDENEVSEHDEDPDYEPSDDECETTDEEYLSSEDDDEKSTDDEVVYEEEGVRITKKMVEEERAKIQKKLERNKELKEAYDDILYNAERNAERNRRECTGCKYGIMNQQAHYNGCLGDEDEY